MMPRTPNSFPARPHPSTPVIIANFNHNGMANRSSSRPVARTNGNQFVFISILDIGSDEGPAWVEGTQEARIAHRVCDAASMMIPSDATDLTRVEAATLNAEARVGQAMTRVKKAEAQAAKAVARAQAALARAGASQATVTTVEISRKETPLSDADSNTRVEITWHGKAGEDGRPFHGYTMKTTGLQRCEEEEDVEDVEIE